MGIVVEGGWVGWVGEIRDGTLFHKILV